MDISSHALNSIKEKDIERSCVRSISFWGSK